MTITLESGVTMTDDTIPPYQTPSPATAWWNGLSPSSNGISRRSPHTGTRCVRMARLVPLLPSHTGNVCAFCTPISGIHNAIAQLHRPRDIGVAGQSAFHERRRRAACVRAAQPDAFCEPNAYAALLPSTCSTMCANSALRLSHCIANPSSVMPGYCIAVKMKRLPAPGRSTTRAGQ